MTTARKLLFFCVAAILIALSIALGAIYISSASRSTQAPPKADATPDPFDRLAEPPRSDPPTQVELGHYSYYISCMVCHGDKGQGLTDEWRNVNPPEDRNCWQSRCHAPNHPPEGFEIPRSAPPVMSVGALDAYPTAADLYEYLRTDMPWAFPGILPDEEYWQLTAFLADANRVVLNKKPVGPDNAEAVLLSLQYAPGQEPDIERERLITGVALVLLLSAVVLQRWSQAS